MMQIELKPSFQALEAVPEKDDFLKREYERLQKENALLKQENARLERKLSRAFYKIHDLRLRLNSGNPAGQVFAVVAVLLVVFLVLYYGTELIDFSLPSSSDYQAPVVERHR